MPPFIPRKRRHSSPLGDEPPLKRECLFDTADKPGVSGTLNDNIKFVETLNGLNTDSDVSSSEYGDLHITKKRNPNHNEDDEEEEEEEVDDATWEDAMHMNAAQPSTPSGTALGDLELTLDKGAHFGSLINPHGKKKGPSRIERQIRVSTHCMHVQFLLFHNLIRNGWACDAEVQRILVSQLPPGVKKEVEKWRMASGMSVPRTADQTRPTPKGKGRRESKNTREKSTEQRDWGQSVETLENNVPNMSRGDPLIRLLKVLAAYWKKRFTINAPGLRKQGYKSLAYLENEIASFKDGSTDHRMHGERLRGLEDFRDHARNCKGSRDHGAQLFAALIRGLDIGARLVASLQPVGFGWGKAEEAVTKRRENPDVAALQREDDMSPSDSDMSLKGIKDRGKVMSNTKSLKSPQSNRKWKYKQRGTFDLPIDLSEDDRNANIESSTSVDEDGSMIEPIHSPPRIRPRMHHDRDLAFPTYWTEVISPITNKVYPVDPIVLNSAIATNQEHLALFESKGAKAEKAKQVFAYVIAYSADGTAKDVTTRYLKRHMWPGRTKGVRLPIEKVPVYNRHGKIKHYEEYDWFKSVMSAYMRTPQMRTAVDDLEEATDLQALKPEKRDKSNKVETLQGYKNSADFVLERHLRREEAILPGSKPVKTFLVGKGDKAKEEAVYRRQDIAICRTGESWHKEGRQVRSGEHLMKMVPVRAVTLTRKREVEEAERDGGQKLRQGLYAWDQTDWIIPPPIANGVIPKNTFGNMDCYVPTMVPQGALHIPLRGTTKICKRLGIDFAEACTGFEFGKQRAVPVITGVVVAAEHEHSVIDEWEKDERERKTKDKGKREKTALAAWRKMLMGLRIMKRVHEEYGGDADEQSREEINPFINKKKLLESQLGEESPQTINGLSVFPANENLVGGFVAGDEEEANDIFAGDGFLSEDTPSHDPGLRIELEGHGSTRSASPKSPTSTPTITKSGLTSDGKGYLDPRDSGKSVMESPKKRRRSKQTSMPNIHTVRSKQGNTRICSPKEKSRR